MKISARQFAKNCRAFILLAPVLALSTIAPIVAASHDDLRVAAVIITEPESMVLIEDAGGVQKWFKVGDSVVGLKVTQIDDDGATLYAADGEVRLSLRGDRSGVVTESRQETVTPAGEQSKSFRYVSLVSRIESDRVLEGENREQAITRTINDALGLSPGARITAIDREAVTTAAEARAELRRRLTGEYPVRIAIENDDLKVLYVVPEP